MHGEQPEEGGFDHELAGKNSTAWNEWVSTDKTDHARLAAAVELFARRSPSLSLPPLGATPDFARTCFERRVSFANFRFPNRADSERPSLFARWIFKQQTAKPK
jgi:hypothetical protein